MNLQDEDDAWVALASASAEKALGHPLDQAALKSLAHIAANMGLQNTLAILIDALDNGTITPVEYLDKLNEAAKASMERNRTLLGDDVFLAVFGEAGLHPEGLVDRKAFLDQFPKPAPAP